MQHDASALADRLGVLVDGFHPDRPGAIPNRPSSDAQTPRAGPDERARLRLRSQDASLARRTRAARC
ncbi:hypothetical protein NUW54_g12432 [Trametes sanguinea]|uniref:Uncharacterized protein n=1 Tax=Trametes sanguinea TaxID=158606 RepID=A0ACC1MXL3_9APHY|nr:hypothetical protein NUW54_g12432 [Trametes sanguinea]